jgi:hypothetical protein
VERSRVCLYVSDVSDERFNLIDRLDQNGDGQLSQRELRSAAKFADRDNGAQPPQAEGPPRYRITIGRDQRNDARRMSVIPQGVGPQWFQKMDGNRDGDVSRREFLGSRALFDRLDADHDGLIDPVEATRE